MIPQAVVRDHDGYLRVYYEKVESISKVINIGFHRAHKCQAPYRFLADFAGAGYAE